MMSPNNLNIIAAAAAALSSSSSPSSLLAASSTSNSSSTTTSSTLVLPSKLAPSTGAPLQWNGTDYAIDNISRQDIHAHDVLSGRGGASNNHPGNEAFRQLVNTVKVDYLQCPKREKPLLAMRIVQAVRAQSPPGRFLQHDKRTDTWRDVGDTKAREKTSQALREGAPIIRDMVHKPPPSALASVLKEVKKEERKSEPIKKSDDTATHNDAYSSNIQPQPLVSSWAPPVSGLPSPPMEAAIKLGASCLTIPKQFPVQEHHIAVHQAPTLNIEAKRPNFYHQHPGEARIVSGDYPMAATRNDPPPVPFEIVRGLLLGHIHPVVAAASILSPEEAAIVAHRHELDASRQKASTAPTEIIHGKKRSVEDASLDVTKDRTQTASDNSLELSRISSSSSSGSDHSEPKSTTTTQPRSHRRTPLKKRKFIDIPVDA